MSKSYHQNDSYSHEHGKSKSQFLIKAYFERFDHLIDEKKYNKSTDIKNIFFMLEEVQQHFNDKAFECFYFLKLINEIEKLKKRCATFTEEFESFLKKNKTFVPTLIQYSFYKLDKFYKNKLFLFLFNIINFQIVLTKEQKECIYQSMYPHIFSFDGMNFCDSLKIMIALKESPTITWQKEWVSSFLAHKNEIDPLMLTYISDHIHLLDEEITITLVQHLAPYKAQQERKFVHNTSRLVLKLNDTEKNKQIIEQSLQLNKIKNANDILFALKGFVHTRGSIPKAKINVINKRFKKEFHQLSRRNIIKIFYYYALLQIDKDHALPILKRVKSYFDQSKDLFNDIDESEFRKLIIAKRYFDVLGFPINITHHSNFEGYLENLRKWVIKTRAPSKAQKYAVNIIKPFLSNIESESYIDVVGDCVDIYVPSSNLVIEVDGAKYHTLRSEKVTSKLNLITQLKTFLLEKHGFHLIRLDAEKVIKEGRPYILTKIDAFLRNELEFLQNDYIQDLYENGGKYSYDIIETKTRGTSNLTIYPI